MSDWTKVNSDERLNSILVCERCWFRSSKLLVEDPRAMYVLDHDRCLCAKCYEITQAATISVRSYHRSVTAVWVCDECGECGCGIDRCSNIVMYHRGHECLCEDCYDNAVAQRADNRESVRNNPILPLNTFGSRVARLKTESKEEREMSSLYKAVYTPRQALLLEYMRDSISEGRREFGITLQGNRVTLRWTMPGEKELVEVHMIVVSTHDERDVEEMEEAEDYDEMGQ